MSCQGLQREEIRAWYWWEGAVANDPEIRLSFDSAMPFTEIEQVISAAHNYDVPMIIADTPTEQQNFHWKGTIPAATEQLAESLAASRLVACAQLAPDGVLAVKTVCICAYQDCCDSISGQVTRAKGALEEMLAAQEGTFHVEWMPIIGNAAYLEWLDNETKTDCAA